MTESDLRNLIRKDTLIETLLDDELRPLLLAYLSGPSQKVRSSLEIAGVVAKTCRATTTQLSDVVAILEADESGAARELLFDLVDHLEIHADVRLALRQRLYP